MRAESGRDVTTARDIGIAVESRIVECYVHSVPGVCRLGDKSKADVDVHGCPACPHPSVQGPSIVASANVFINGAAGLRINDMGIHTACCGPNMWKITGASGQVFLNGAQLVRQGDPTLHCGGPGQMIEASGNVHDGSPMITGMAGANPMVSKEGINWTEGLGGSLASGFATGGLDALSAVIEKGAIPSEEAQAAGAWVPKGAATAAKALKWGSRGADFAINVGPALAHGDTHEAIKKAVATGAGIAAGSAVGGVCEGGTLGLGTPACVAAGVATSTGVSYATEKVYDPVVHAGGKVVHTAGKALPWNW
jgi:uncharacterized Zn-binding protein involved in type VI secretion